MTEIEKELLKLPCDPGLIGNALLVWHNLKSEWKITAPTIKLKTASGLQSIQFKWQSAKNHLQATIWNNASNWLWRDGENEHEYMLEPVANIALAAPYLAKMFERKSAEEQQKPVVTPKALLEAFAHTDRLSPEAKKRGLPLLQAFIDFVAATQAPIDKKAFAAWLKSLPKDLSDAKQCQHICAVQTADRANIELNHDKDLYCSFSLGDRKSVV